MMQSGQLGIGLLKMFRTILYSILGTAWIFIGIALNDMHHPAIAYLDWIVSFMNFLVSFLYYQQDKKSLVDQKEV
jgi:hypothetical protein